MAQLNEPVISPSLLDSVDFNKPVSREFSLGMEDQYDCGSYCEELLREMEGSSLLDYLTGDAPPSTSSRVDTRSGEPSPLINEPRPKKPRLDTRCTEKANEPHPFFETRYQLCTEGELKSLSTGFKPQNTNRSTKWSIENFSSWMAHRNSRPGPIEKCPEDVLKSKDPELLSKWIGTFAAETRKTNGEPYTPKTLYAILTGILRYMKEDDDANPNFLNKEDGRFKKLHNTIDSVFRKLRASGVGAEKKTAEPFTKEEEAQLWESGVIGDHAPRALLRAIFFYNGKNFCLRGGEEHRQLRLSQLKRTQDGYTYTENASKNRAGGLAQLRVENKCVQVLRNEDAGAHCHCHLLDVYMSKLPAEAKAKDIFYVRPLEKMPSDDTKPWFTGVPVGRNKLSKMVPDMCKEAKISGHKTNHSLRATGATELYTAGVPEKIIQERTGHRTLESLRMYERTSEKQQQAVSKVISARVATNFQCEMEKLNLPAHQVPTSMMTPTRNVCTFGPTNTGQFTPNMSFNGCSVNININPVENPQLTQYYTSASTQMQQTNTITDN